MKIRVISILLCMILAVSLFGCDIIDSVKNGGSDKIENTTSSNSQNAVDPEKFDMIDRALVEFDSPLFETAELTKGYESLKTEAQRLCYQNIDNNVMYISKQMTKGAYTLAPIKMDNVDITEAQLHLVLSAYTMDHPEIFWLDSKFAYSVMGTVTSLYLNSTMSGQDIVNTADSIRERIDEIYTSVSAGMSAYERELALHDAFISRCEYADVKDDSRIYTCAGGLADGLAVCEGYSRSMQILLSLADIETYYVFGVGNEDLHMWNVVNIDDVWYHLDATWNDNENGNSYKHFNLNESEITEDHTMSPYYWELTESEVSGGDSGLAASFNIYIPDCSDGNGSYYARKAINVTDYSDSTLQKIAEGFTSALDVGEEYIYLYFDPDYIVYDNAVLKFFDDETNPLIFDCIEMANDMIMYTQIEDSTVEIEYIHERNIVCVYFEQASNY